MWFMMPWNQSSTFDIVLLALSSQESTLSIKIFWCIHSKFYCVFRCFGRPLVTWPIRLCFLYSHIPSCLRSKGPAGESGISWLSFDARGRNLTLRTTCNSNCCVTTRHTGWRRRMSLDMGPRCVWCRGTQGRYYSWLTVEGYPFTSALTAGSLSPSAAFTAKSTDVTVYRDM